MKRGQFNLRTLLVLMSMAAVLAMWGTAWWRVRQARSQAWRPFNPPRVEVTIEAIDQAVWQSHDGPGIETRVEAARSGAENEATERLRTFLRGDATLLAGVKQLNLQRVVFTEALVGDLAQLTELRQLILRRCQLPRNTLHRLRLLTTLHWLELRDCQIDVRALTDLDGFPGLRHLSLRDNRLGDQAVEPLAKLAGLERLDLRGNPISPDALRRLRAALSSCQIVADALPVSEPSS